MKCLRKFWYFWTEFVAGDDNVCTDKDNLEFVQSSKSTIDANSGYENEMNNAASVPTSSEMRNIKKSGAAIEGRGKTKRRRRKGQDGKSQQHGGGRSKMAKGWMDGYFANLVESNAK
ncbi:hypothetical protein TNCV_4442791 [Trichonephila clavipes]|nr:hypothetical protein TNCV_4442791 [Trichonephila clavipes]